MADTYEADVGLQGAATLSTSVTDMNHENGDLLDHEKFKMYQPLCAQANFLAIDRIN